MLLKMREEKKREELRKFVPSDIYHVDVIENERREEKRTEEDRREEESRREEDKESIREGTRGKKERKKKRT